MDYRNAFDMTGSVAVITGGSRGIGYESAAALGRMRGEGHPRQSRSERAGRGCPTSDGHGS